MSCEIFHLNKCVLLVELYNNAKIVEEDVKESHELLTIEKARGLIDRGSFGIFQGRALHFNFPFLFRDELVDTSRYNAINGSGAFEAIVKKLSEKAAMQTQLYKCIDEGNFEEVVSITREYPDLMDSEDLSRRGYGEKNRVTPLFEIIKQLCDYYAYPGEGPESLEKHGRLIKILNFLLDNSNVRWTGPNGDNILHFIFDFYCRERSADKILTLFINSRRAAEILTLKSARNSWGKTPFEMAASSGLVSSFCLFLENGVDIFETNQYGENIFQAILDTSSKVLEKTKLEMLQLLISKVKTSDAEKLKAYLNSRSNILPPSFAIAIKKGEIECAKFLAQFTEKDCFIAKPNQDSLLHLAVSIDSEESALETLAYLFSICTDWDLNLLDSQNRSCLHIVATPKYGDKIKYRTLQFLIDNGADINLPLPDNGDGNTLLHDAVRNGNIELVRFLLRNRADPNILNEYGYTALDYTMPDVNQDRLTCLPIIMKENTEIASLLKAAGAVEVVLPCFDIPKTPVKLIEQLELELKLSREEAPTLSAEEEKTLSEDTKLIQDLFASQQFFEFFCSSDDEVKKLKEKYSDCHHFLEPVYSYSTACMMHTFTNLSAEQRKILADLQEKINAYQEIMNGYLETFDSLQVERLECATAEEIQAAIKKHGIENILIGFGMAEVRELRIYKDLSPKQKEKLREIQNVISTHEVAIKADWHAAMEACSKSLMETRHFNYEGVRGRYLENVKEDPTGFCLLSPIFSNNLQNLSVYQKLNPREQSMLDNLQARTKHVIMKNRLGYDLLSRSMKPKSIDKYLSKYKTLPITIGRHTLNFVDLSKATDYRFFVNTVLTRPERLRELVEGDPKFLQFTPFWSACFIDEVTRGFAGGHQSNLLFPTYLVLDVPFEAIEYIGPTDIGSPYNCLASKRIAYLKLTSAVRHSMDRRQALYQLKILDSDKTRIVPDSTFDVRPALKCDRHFEVPGYKYMGSLPLYTPEGVLRDTHSDTGRANSYAEAIIRGNAMLGGVRSQGRLLLVEKYFLDEFLKEKYGRTSESDSKRIEESLEILANIERLTGGRIRLALIETNVLGFKRKMPVLEQLKMLEEDKPILRRKLTTCSIRQKRFEMAGREIPKELTEALAVRRRELESLIVEQQYLEELGKNPPRVTKLFSRAGAAAAAAASVPATAAAAAVPFVPGASARGGAAGGGGAAAAFPMGRPV